MNFINKFDNKLTFSETGLAYLVWNGDEDLSEVEIINLGKTRTHDKMLINFQNQK